ncbi:MAG: methyl-accepting chemotaxis protein [Chloroflexota bacterium]
MNLLNNYKVANKLIGNNLLVALMIVIVAGLSYAGMRTMRGALDTMYNDRVLPLEQVSALSMQVFKYRGDIMKYLLMPNERTVTETEINEDIANIDQALSALKTQHLDADELQALGAIERNWATYRADIDTVMAQVQQGRQDSALASLAAGGRAAISRDRLAASLTTLGQITSANAQQSNLEIAGTFRSLTTAVVVVGLVNLLVALAIGAVLAASITGPLNRGVSMMQELSQGHLGSRINLGSRQDEVGQLASAMDSFADDLQYGVVASLKKIANGDLEIEITAKDARDEIAPAIQQTTEMLRGLVDEAQMLNQAAMDGRLSARGNPAKFKGAFRQVIEGMNNTLEGVIVPINAAAAYVDSISRGEVPPQISQRYYGDFDVLKENLNRMGQRLREMLNSIAANASDLNSAAAEILASTTQQASGASEQSAAISQTTTTVQEMKTITEQASGQAQEVASASQRTVDVARSGQRAVQDTIESMAQIKERVESIAENILALSDQTQQIGEIISTVSELASRSNMLALNASVEAARAGEHGKGFAVVAMEVRSLADQSKQATAQVKAILSEIQKATNATVMATEEGTKGVERGVQTAAQARESIEALAAVINESAMVATQVVVGGQQQVVGIEQIALAMQNINQVTVQSLASIRQAERSAQNLNEMARAMTTTVNQYRLK